MEPYTNGAKKRRTEMSLELTFLYHDTTMTPKYPHCKASADIGNTVLLLEVPAEHIYSLKSKKGKVSQCRMPSRGHTVLIGMRV